ncbi:helix-turn-helix domain-containing protein [Catenulispora sp. GP43]|uniref:helix-turn-helix domain-containing protein n=1 Tax=Catenulispora sp. GP43 TaxID=3156263 RepID=UPI0035168979
MRRETRGYLIADDTAERNFSEITRDLKSARLKKSLSQNALSSSLPVRGRAISEWETGAIEPKLNHLILLTHELDLRLTIIGLDGKPCNGPSRQRPGESWVKFERRRLAWPLRARRVAQGMSQTELGDLVGVSRDSIQRWELAHVPPRPIALVVWAQKLGYSLALRQMGEK